MKKDKIIIGVLGVILVILLGVIIYLLLNGSKTIREITGNVIVADKEYVIIEANDNDYLISNIKGSYEVGDTVKFTYEDKNLDSNASPKTIKISDEDLIKHKIDSAPIKDNKDEDEEGVENKDNTDVTSSNNEVSKPSNNDTNSSTESSINNTSSNNVPNKEVTPNVSNNDNTTADTTVINYFNDYQKEITNTSVSNPKSTLKNGFVTIVDFLFYNGTIKGYTFKDLTNTTKLKVLAMALYFDNKIEEYFPGYKESISNTTSKVYNTVKEKAISAYLTITTSICASNTTLCENAKEGLGELKNNFGLTWELLKSIAGDGLTNLKNWYEIWRES